MTAMPPRFDITADQITDQMRAFYVEIRAHPVLGPIFINRIGTDAATWRTHEDKIASFWRNAILHERCYDGRPQQVHSAVSAILPEHFAIWLDLFENVALKTLPETTATPWVALARRIGAGLRMGVQHTRARPGAVPVLR